MLKRIQKQGEPTAFPSSLKPMMARLVDKAFSDSNWLFEPKLDGFRVLAFVRQTEVTLHTRNGNDFTGHYPHVASQLGTRRKRQFVLDGEMVALNERGLPDFNLIQHSAEIVRKGPRLQVDNIVYYPFDVLHVNGTSLLACNVQNPVSVHPLFGHCFNLGTSDSNSGSTST